MRGLIPLALAALMSAQPGQQEITAQAAQDDVDALWRRIFELPHSRIGVNVPAERLFHVNGTPREQFVPSIRVDPSVPGAGDPWIALAQDSLARAKRP